MKYLFSALFLSLLVVTTQSSYFSRIANPYHGVYLNTTLFPSPSPTYWIIQDNMTISTPDLAQQLCVNSIKQLGLCSAGVGSVWGYQAPGSLGLYTVIGTDKFYLTLDQNGAGVTKQQSANSDKILLSPAVGDSDTPLVFKLKKTEERLRVEMEKIKKEYSKLLAQKDKIVGESKSLMKDAETAEEDYDKKIKEIGEKLKEFQDEAQEMKTSMMGEITKMNTTRNDMVDKVLPSISEDIDRMKTMPDQFLQRLNDTDLETSFKEQIAEINRTLSGYLHKHRIAPVSVYDWLIILTTLLYVIYFVDIIGRSAGWKCLVKKKTVTTELEMEAPSNIQPEYFLQDEDEDSNFQYARARESIKGKLKLNPVE